MGVSWKVSWWGGGGARGWSPGAHGCPSGPSCGWSLRCLMASSFGCLTGGPQGLTDGAWGTSWSCPGVSWMPSAYVVDILEDSLMSPLKNHGWSSEHLIDIPKICVAGHELHWKNPFLPRAATSVLPLPVLVPQIHPPVLATLRVLGGVGWCLPATCTQTGRCRAPAQPYWV